MKTTEELLKQRYSQRLGDKWDMVAKQFDYYDMADFAEFYAKEEPFPGFWERLESFVKDVQVNDPVGQEEKEMILSVCKKKQQ